MADEYNLQGPQVEPEASYWNHCPRPCPVDVRDLTAVTDDPHNPRYFPPYPHDDETIDAELQELRDLAKRREDPTQLVSTRPCRERLPISLFLQLRPVPLGASVNTARGDAFPVILIGAELARYFENETPGLAHRQALNYMIRDTNWSPPRQALVWAALDVTILSALSAAWYYKWLSPRTDVSRRQRPVEADPALDVLFDFPVNSTGTGSSSQRRPDPNPSPGTPRHPAYPSGHSTYSGAASELLSFFFPDYRRELDFLADNIGLARLWAGVHWRSDHEQGNRLGRTVACLVIDQLRRSGIPLVPPMRPENQMPPTRDELQAQADIFRKQCGKANPGPVPGLSQPVSEPCVPIPPYGAEPEGKIRYDKQGYTIVG
jgi:membrane-associated phospholipid phosphatase